MLTRLVAPAIVVTTADAKANLRVTFTRDDALIADCVAAATAYLDGPTGILGGKCIADQTWRYTTADFADPLRIPLKPASAVSSVKYLDTSGVEQTFSSASYYLFSDDIGPYVRLIPNAVWPDTSARDDAVRIEFVAGYGSTIPPAIRAAILKLTALLYDSGDAEVDPAKFPAGFSYRDLVSPISRQFF